MDYPSNEFDEYDKKKIREKLALPKNKIVISFLGMIRKDKKIEIAINIMRKLPEKYHLLIAGVLADYKEQDIKSKI